MTTRLRSANLEQEANFDEGVGELSVEEKYAEVKQLIVVGKEKGFLLYDEIYETLPEEITSLPEELDEIYIRFADLGIDVVEDSEKPLPTSSKAIVTIDGTIEEKEMDQREEVQQDIIAANSGIVDKTNDPVRMYLREMGTVKLLDRQGEVDIAKRIEKGERRVYKALSQNRIILEEILKIYESAKKDPRVIKEMIDLAMPEDETIARGRPTKTASRSSRSPPSTRSPTSWPSSRRSRSTTRRSRMRKRSCSSRRSSPSARSSRRSAPSRSSTIELANRIAPGRLHAADAQSDDQQAEGHRQRACPDRVDGPQGRRGPQAREGQDPPRFLSPPSAEVRRTSSTSWRRSTARSTTSCGARSARSAPAKRKPIRPSRS